MTKTPVMPSGTLNMMTSGSMQRLELRREHHVDERERHDRREAEALERLLLRERLPAELHAEAVGRRRLVERVLRRLRSPRRGPVRARRSR